jgi:hypothetical protein
VLLDPSPAIPIAVIVADPTGSTGGLYIERALTVAGEGHEFAGAALRQRDESFTAAERFGELRGADERACNPLHDQQRRAEYDRGAHGHDDEADVDPGTLADVSVLPRRSTRNRCERQARR